MLKTNYKLFTIILLLVTGGLFTVGMMFSSMTQIILHTLEFMILFEIVRALAEFVFDNSNRMKMRYIVDSAILFAVRELYVGLIEIHKDLILGVIIVTVSLLSLGALIFYRTKLVKYSPDFFND